MRDITPEGIKKQIEKGIEEGTTVNYHKEPIKFIGISYILQDGTKEFVENKNPKLTEDVRKLFKK